MTKMKLVQDDPWLESNEHEIYERHQRFEHKKQAILSEHGSLTNYAHRHHYLGFNYDPNTKTYTYREWAPHAQKLELIGDFNHWNGQNHALVRLDEGIWEIIFTQNDYFKAHPSSRCKVRVYANGTSQDKIPAYTTETIQDPESHDFSAVIRTNRTDFQWSDAAYSTQTIAAPLIYECHIGLSSEEQKVSTYAEFTDQVLPRIKALGYNCIQLMAVQEHPYYGSFGYHVSNFFAVSSRFGSANDLKHLINTAHQMGIAVVMDIVHSHSVKNTAEGLNNFDGSGGQYFHSGERGIHPQWDSLIFDYGNREVQKFLLSNLAYWLEEFHFDGFRFDGVTSMMYHHHGLDKFTSYDKYFKEGIEWDAITYLQLANTLIKEINPHALSIAEDMSGMPGLCRPIEEGGIGFDYRLGMGIPDYWIKILKHLQDEQWNLQELWGMLSNRRVNEKTIAYSESHDQALVGDKTLAFWLMDQEMYFHMGIHDENHLIDRGISLHKMIRFITAVVGGEGYLNFIGNEFGHPEWLDFPREGNNWSYQYCRRQWSLVDNEELKFKFLNAFEKEMLGFLKTDGLLQADMAQALEIDADRKIIVFERFNFIFVFNFHSTESYFDFQIPTNAAGQYQMILDTDQKEWGGFGRIEGQQAHFSKQEMGKNWIQIYSPNRSAQVYQRVD